ARRRCRRAPVDRGFARDLACRDPFLRSTYPARQPQASRDMSLEVSAVAHLGEFALDADFKSESRVTAIFGPSGSGKTSVLNVIAGLLCPERGRVAVDGAVLVDTGAGVFVPPHRRRIGYVFQDDRLFPHLSVKGNLLYGRIFAGSSRHHAAFEEVIDLLDLRALLRP